MMNNRTKGYHAAKASSNPNHYRELEYDTLDMFGVSDEELLKLGSPEELQEYKEYIAHRAAIDPARVWSLNYWLAEMIELPLSEIFTPAEAREYKRLLRLHDPDYPKNWSFACLWMFGVTEKDLDEIMTAAEKLEYLKFAERTNRYSGLGIQTYLEDFTPEELVNSGAMVAVHHDQMNGFTISQNGELRNLVSWNQTGSKSIETAVQMGASKFECYALYLPYYLARFGFTESRRMANPCRGAPDIVFLERIAWPVMPA